MNQNAEGVREFQPRVARASALPWGLGEQVTNPERVAEIIRSNRHWFNPKCNDVTSRIKVMILATNDGLSRTLSEFLNRDFLSSQGVALGWNSRTPSAFVFRREPDNYLLAGR